MKKIGLLLTGVIVFFLSIGLSQAQFTGLTSSDVLIEEYQPSTQFATIEEFLNNLKLVEFKNYDGSISYRVEFQSFQFWNIEKLIIRAVPEKITTTKRVHPYLEESFEFEIELFTIRKDFILQQKFQENGISNVISIGMYVKLTATPALSCDKEAKEKMAQKIEEAVKNKTPLVFIAKGIQVKPNRLKKFDFDSRITLELDLTEVK